MNDIFSISSHGENQFKSSNTSEKQKQRRYAHNLHKVIAETSFLWLNVKYCSFLSAKWLAFKLNSRCHKSLNACLLHTLFACNFVLIGGSCMWHAAWRLIAQTAVTASAQSRCEADWPQRTQQVCAAARLRDKTCIEENMKLWQQHRRQLLLCVVAVLSVVCVGKQNK